MCQKHYTRWRKRGDPNIIARQFYRPLGLGHDELITLFLEQAVREGECLILDSRTYGRKYPVARIDGKQTRISRFLVSKREGRELLSSEIVRHLCHRPACINEKHLVLGTRKDNRQDNYEAGLRMGAEKLNARDVQEIRRRHEEGEALPSIWMDYLNVGWVSMRRIVDQVTWAEVR